MLLGLLHYWSHCKHICKYHSLCVRKTLLDCFSRWIRMWSTVVNTYFTLKDSKCSILCDQRQGDVYFIKGKILQGTKSCLNSKVTGVIMQELNGKQICVRSLVSYYAASFIKNLNKSLPLFLIYILILSKCYKSVLVWWKAVSPQDSWLWSHTSCLRDEAAISNVRSLGPPCLDPTLSSAQTLYFHPLTWTNWPDQLTLFWSSTAGPGFCHAIPLPPSPECLWLPLARREFAGVHLWCALRSVSQRN